MESVGYAPTYANSYCGKMWENKALIAEIDKQVADLSKVLEHDRTIAIKLLTDNLVRLQAKADAGDVQAASAITACIRELNAISNLHSSTVNTNTPAVEMVEAEAADRKAFTEWQLRQGISIKREA